MAASVSALTSSAQASSSYEAGAGLPNGCGWRRLRRLLRAVDTMPGPLHWIGAATVCTVKAKLEAVVGRAMALCASCQSSPPAK